VLASVSDVFTSLMHPDVEGSVAGVSCGIPDFRSRDGLYATLKDRAEYDLDDPQQM
jgi:NAD+-dependent protein deacetylase SIR2